MAISKLCAQLFKSLHSGDSPDDSVPASGDTSIKNDLWKQIESLRLEINEIASKPITQLDSTSTDFKINAIIWVVVSGIGAYVFFRWKKPNSLASSRKLVKNPCVVCRRYERFSVFLPCGHYACCFFCTEEIMAETSRCPICKKMCDYAFKMCH